MTFMAHFDTGVVRGQHFQSTHLGEGKGHRLEEYSAYTFDNVDKSGRLFSSPSGQWSDSCWVDLHMYCSPMSTILHYA